MNNSSYFGKYTLSDATINKLTNCEDLLKPSYQPSDSAWHRLFNSEEPQEELGKEDESMEIDRADENESADESMLQSSQFFFTQVQRKKPATPVAFQVKGADLNNATETTYESLQQSKKLNTEILKDLTDSEILTIFEKLSDRLNLNNTHDLCNSLCDMQGDLAVQYIKPICSKLLLQKIIALEEPARIITLAINKLINKFPQDILKSIFIPLVNADLKDTSVVSEIINNYPRQQKTELVSEFLTSIQEIKVWHMSVIPTLINIKIDSNLKDRLIQLLLDKSTTFSKDKNYSKFILSFIKLNTPFSEEQKSSLDEIVAINESIFKKAMESLLNKMYFHRDLWHINAAN